MNKKKAVYPGTFDPVTFGHLDMLNRALTIFDEILIAVAENPRKSPLFSLEERIELIRQVAPAPPPAVRVVGFHSLLVDFVRKNDCQVILRGVRAVSDFDYELRMALINQTLARDIETVFLMPSEKYMFITSTMIREISELGGDLAMLVPPTVEEALKKKFFRSDTQ
ncbi:MAG: pantetheine-phosphate adenylyltransferase [Nitrospirae bacterium]|nr:pantetheine-phosphate adenylyltransferase [Nitrospirota bacterium]